MFPYFLVSSVSILSHVNIYLEQQKVSSKPDHVSLELNNFQTFSPFQEQLKLYLSENDTTLNLCWLCHQSVSTALQMNTETECKRIRWEDDGCKGSE